MAEVLDEHEPGHSVASESLRPFLRNGFPWHLPDVPHLELNTPERWWSRVEPLLACAYEGVGIPNERATKLGELAARHCVDADYWRLYDDSLPTLSRLRDNGWRHVILSNHVPELSQLVARLGLARLIDNVVNSAITGYEKPHPQAFALAREAAGDPNAIWMVGDNPHADFDGAEAVGIPAILISRNETADRRARTVRSLTDLEDWL